MNCREIVIAHLKSIGADGLCINDCGCGIDDFAPCGSDFSDCVPARARIIPIDESQRTAFDREMIDDGICDPGEQYYIELDVE